MVRRVVTWLRIFGVLLVVLFGQSCVRITLPTFPHQLKLIVKGQTQPITVKFYGVDQRVVGDFVSLLHQSLSITTRLWGPLLEASTIRVFPNHKTLEQAVNRQYKWLRAWAMYDELYIQTPRTWKRGRLRALPKLLTHELTHVLMYQRCCRRADWYKRKIPFWFREGMASVTASQGTWRMSRRQLFEMFESNFGKRLWKNPARFIARHHRETYSLAHWMFHDLLDWCSDAPSKSYRRLESMLDGMKQGLTYKGAFRRSCGFSLKTFRARFAKKMGLAGH